MTNYTKGAEYERDFCKRMEAKGYLAIRSAGSHGMVDVVLIPTRAAERLSVICADDMLLLEPDVSICQLKRGKENCTKEKENFAGLNFFSNIHKLWVSKKDREAEVIELL